MLTISDAARTPTRFCAVGAISKKELKISGMRLMMERCFAWKNGNIDYSSNFGTMRKNGFIGRIRKQIRAVHRNAWMPWGDKGGKLFWLFLVEKESGNIIAACLINRLTFAPICRWKFIAKLSKRMSTCVRHSVFAQASCRRTCNLSRVRIKRM